MVAGTDAIERVRAQRSGQGQPCPGEFANRFTEFEDAKNLNPKGCSDPKRSRGAEVHGF